MTTPVKNNQVPPQPSNDPYAKNYGTGGTQTDPYGGSDYGSGYDPGMGGDQYGDYGAGGDEFIGDQGYGEEGPQGPGGAPQGELTMQGLRDMANQLKDKLGDKYAAFWGRINATAGMSPEKAQAEMAKIAEEMNNIAYPPEAGGAEGAEGAEGEDGGKAQMKKDLEDYKKAINDNPDLSSDQKAEYTEKIDKWLKGLELGTITPETIDENLGELKQEVSDATAFPPIFQKLEELTGKSPKELEDLFKKHGLDPKNLPNPPDAKVAELLNDKDFAANLNELKQTAKDDYGKLKEQIDKKIQECNSRNDAARQNTSVTNDNFQPFRDIEDIYEHKDDMSKTVAADRKKVAEEAAKLLSAMYGKEVTAVTDDAKAGCISFDGTEMNVMQNTFSGDISFTTDTKIDYPPVDRPTFWKDCEGDGTIACPQWMQDANYPHASYDGGFEWGHSS
ncbi:MAG: hypothetical protein U1F66_08660 [bacterium]